MFRPIFIEQLKNRAREIKAYFYLQIKPHHINCPTSHYAACFPRTFHAFAMQRSRHVVHTNAKVNVQAMSNGIKVLNFLRKLKTSIGDEPFPLRESLVFVQ